MGARRDAASPLHVRIVTVLMRQNLASCRRSCVSRRVLTRVRTRLAPSRAYEPLAFPRLLRGLPPPPRPPAPPTS
jgi:hypothetical protein